MNPLFLEVAKTQGMRELLVAKIFGDVAHLGERTRITHDGELVVRIWVRRWLWVALGIYHLAMWWKVRKACKAAMKSLKVHAPLQVKVRTV